VCRDLFAIVAEEEVSMGIDEKIDIDLFKVVSRAIAHAESLEAMTAYLSQLLVAALGIKGCSIFALEPQTGELEILGSFGLSVRFLNKGPVLSKKSIARTIKGSPVVLSDVEKAKALQYPAETRAEGIRAIVALPVTLYGKVIGTLRLYHSEVWEISRRDLDSLMVLAEIVGLAMVYTRLAATVQNVKDAVGELDMVWTRSAG
jgi:transcriptional regulator with GAF, ATPase, and Fis domain